MTGFSCDYEDVVLHALSRDNNGAEQSASFYLQLALQNLCDSTGHRVTLDTERESEDEASDEKPCPFAEVHFWADDEDAEGTRAEAIFLAMSECAALHPSSESESEGGDESASEPEALAAVLDDNGDPMTTIAECSKKSKLDFSQSER